MTSRLDVQLIGLLPTRPTLSHYVLDVPLRLRSSALSRSPMDAGAASRTRWNSLGLAIYMSARGPVNTPLLLIAALIACACLRQGSLDDLSRTADDAVVAIGICLAIGTRGPGQPRPIVTGDFVVV